MEFAFGVAADAAYGFRQVVQLDALRPRERVGNSPDGVNPGGLYACIPFY